MSTAMAILAAVFGVLFITLPISVVQVLMSGWFELARRYPGKPILTAAVSDLGYTTLRLSRHRWYRVIARYTADDDHLHLRLISPAAILHERISIPWAAIEQAHRNPADTSLILVSIADHPIRIAVPPRLLEREIAVRQLIAAQNPPEGSQAP